MSGPFWISDRTSDYLGGLEESIKIIEEKAKEMGKQDRIPLVIEQVILDGIRKFGNSLPVSIAVSLKIQMDREDKELGGQEDWPEFEIEKHLNQNIISELLDELQSAKEQIDGFIQTLESCK